MGCNAPCKVGGETDPLSFVRSIFWEFSNVHQMHLTASLWDDSLHDDPIYGASSATILNLWSFLKGTPKGLFLCLLLKVLQSVTAFLDVVPGTSNATWSKMAQCREPAVAGALPPYIIRQNPANFPDLAKVPRDLLMKGFCPGHVLSLSCLGPKSIVWKSMATIRIEHTFGVTPASLVDGCSKHELVYTTSNNQITAITLLSDLAVQGLTATAQASAPGGRKDAKLTVWNLGFTSHLCRPLWMRALRNLLNIVMIYIRAIWSTTMPLYGRSYSRNL